MSFAASHLNLFYILLCQDTLFMLRAVPLTSLGIITLDKYTRTTTRQRRDLVARLEPLVSRIFHCAFPRSLLFFLYSLFTLFGAVQTLLSFDAVEELSFVVN